MRWSLPLVAPIVLALACDGGDPRDLAGSGLDSAPSPGTAPRSESADPGAAPQLSDAGAPAAEVACIDEQILQLPLFDEPAPGAVTNTGEGGVFESAIDATAGGLATSTGFVYARFTERGLEKLVLDDEAALASTAWHIAFRRYVVRLNSGVSGPSDVVAARTLPATQFDALTTLPPDLIFRAEQYYTDRCEYVPDASGIGAPDTVLSSFWSYTACVAMTRNVFVLALPGGRHVKLQVLAYYAPENQRRCDEQGSTTMPSGAGSLRVRWAYLD